MVTRLALTALLLAGLSTTVGSAQDAERGQQPPAQPPSTPAPAAKEQPKETATQPDLRRMGSGPYAGVNVQVEVTLTDQAGNAPPEKKLVSLLTVHGFMGRVRANATTLKPGRGPIGSNLNVDARPNIMEGNRVMLELTLEYTPGRDSDVATPTNLNQSLAVTLVSGKPLTISQAADPISDRRLTVEVKATILK
jgi:hypothetical protein